MGVAINRNHGAGKRGLCVVIETWVFRNGIAYMAPSHLDMVLGRRSTVPVLLAAQAVALAVVPLDVATGTVSQHVAENFLGVNIDSASLAQETLPHRLNFEDEGLLALGTLLASAGASGVDRSILRIGGSTAEDVGWGPGTDQRVQVSGRAAESANQPSPRTNSPVSSHAIDQAVSAVATHKIHPAPPACVSPRLTPQVDTAYWDTIMNFVSATGFQLVWDLNAMKMRDPATNRWNSTNGEALLRYVAARPLQRHALGGLQLGNEPGHFYNSVPAGTAANASQHGADWLALRDLVQDVYQTRSGLPVLQGPDVCFGLGKMNGTGGHEKCADLTYLSELLAAATDAEGCSIEELTVHNYGLAGKAHGDPGQCTLADFLDPSLWEPQMRATLRGWAETRDAACPKARMVLSETASNADGGCALPAAAGQGLGQGPGAEAAVSNTFASGFFWLPQLGLVSALGYWKLFRQDLVGYSGIGTWDSDGHLVYGGSSYAMAGDPGWVGSPADPESPDPVRTAPLLGNPDLYTSVLWKRLMGGRVLAASAGGSAGGAGSGLQYNSTGGGGASSRLRVFAACAKAPAPVGAVALAWANLAPAAVSLEVTLGGAHRTEYHLAPPAGAGNADADTQSAQLSALSSRFVSLNGGPALTVKSELAGKQVDAAGPLRLEGYTYGFAVYPDAAAQACM